MPLDKDAMDAVELLVSAKAMHDVLKRSELAQNKILLTRYLDDKAEAERTDYPAIIALAAERLSKQAVPPQVAQAQTVKSSPVGRRKATSERPSGILPERSSAPYRFIAIPDQVVAAQPETLGPIDRPLPEGYCATIEFELIAETPLLIGGPSQPRGDNDRASNAVLPLKIGNQYVIPGATQRGLIRSAVEILSYSKLTQANLHYRFGLRDFVHPVYAEHGVSKPASVHAGFLTIRKSQETDESDNITDDREVWQITPAKDWHPVLIESLGEIGADASDVKAIQRNGKTVLPWSSKSLEDKYKSVGIWKASGARTLCPPTLFNFRKLPPNQYGETVFVADKAGATRAMFVASGRSPDGKKKHEYIVVPDDRASAIPIDRDTVELFERMYTEPAKGARRTAIGSWKTLERLARGAGVPVFYIGSPDGKAGDGQFFFGLTRLFKIPHRHSVGDVLRRQAAHTPKARMRPGADGKPVLEGYANVDFTESLFGYVMEPGDLGIKKADSSTAPNAVARKGRIAFAYGYLSRGTPAEIREQSAIQMSPRASYAPFYLRSQKGATKDWSDDTSRLAGRKAYFPRFETPPSTAAAMKAFDAFQEAQEQAIREGNNNRPISQEIYSQLSFLVPKSGKPLVFDCCIEMRNVTAAEIGAVLYALTHGGDGQRRFRHMVGRGKPFGAGQMRLGTVAFRPQPNDPAHAAHGALLKPPEADELFDPARGFGWLGKGDTSLKPFLDAFEGFMRESLGKATYPMVEPVQQWLGMADPSQAAGQAKAERLGYRPYLGTAPFPGYKKLREATQRMNTKDAPLDIAALMAAPESGPPRA